RALSEWPHWRSRRQRCDPRSIARDCHRSAPVLSAWTIRMPGERTRADQVRRGTALAATPNARTRSPWSRGDARKVNIKRFCPGAPLPVRKTTGAAGYDLPICAQQHLVGLDGEPLAVDEEDCILIP